jgi:hypothetical protein
MAASASANITACARVIADDLMLVDDDELPDLMLHDEYQHFKTSDATRLIEHLVTDTTFLSLMNPELLDERMKRIGLDDTQRSQITGLFAYNLQTLQAHITFEAWVRIYVIDSASQDKLLTFCIPSRLLDSMNDRMTIGVCDVTEAPKINHFKDSFNYIGMASRAETILYFVLSSCSTEPLYRDVGYSFDFMKLNIQKSSLHSCSRHAFVKM